jgi:hypothetical protein
MSNEAFARVKIDARRAQQDWDVLDTNTVPRYAGVRVQQALSQRRLMNGATDGATLEPRKPNARMHAGSAADGDIMIENVRPSHRVS